MNVTTITGFALVLLLGLVIGYWYRGRSFALKLEEAHAAGRSELTAEVAKLTERATFFERDSNEAKVRLASREAALQESDVRATSASAEVLRLQEREASLLQQLSALPLAQERLEQAQRELSELRELSARQLAQLEASDATIKELRSQLQDLQARNGDLSARLDAATHHAQQVAEQLATARAQVDSLTTTISAQERSLFETTQRCESLNEQLTAARASNAELTTTLQKDREAAGEKLDLLINARNELVQAFKVISNELLEEKSRKFTEQNSQALTQLLDPLKERLGAFQQKVDEVYRTEGQERAALGEQLKQLLRLNQSLSEDAQNLTRALKGDQKTQGTWGEIVLATVLEQAGLVEGTHFDTQASFEGDDNRRAIPDVVVRLPGDRQLVVDSKVSLTAYERACSSESEEERDVCIKQHVTSLRNHIRALSEKNYQQLYQLKSLDFVLLFVPLEPAFATAVSNDNQIFREAWDRNVILVSPSTLLFVVRTVAYLWRQETQAKNVIEICKRGASLYDKFCGFVDEIESVGKALGRTQKAYDDALRKLAVGDGNLIRQAEMLRDLGVKPTKQLPIHLVDRAMSKAQQNLLDSGAAEDVTPAQATPVA